MPIEFRCSQCGKLLRTGDDTAGRQAQCPNCGTISVVPDPTVPALAPLDAGGNPFGAAPQSFRPEESGNPYQSPASVGPSDRGYQGSQFPIAPAILDFGDIFSRTWTIFKDEWGICLGVVVVALALTFVVNIASEFLPFVGFVVAFLFQTWINIGKALFFLKKARGQDASLDEVFKGSPYFGKILLASLLIGSIVLGIVLVFVLLPVLLGMAVSKDAALVLGVVGGGVAIVASYFLMLIISQFYFLILDRDVGVIESLAMSKDLMEGNKLTLFLIWLVAGLAGCAIGILTCGLGFLAVVPFLELMTPVIYLTITGQPTAEGLRSDVM